METETIDRLFLELSQVTQATTKKEIELMNEVEKLKRGEFICQKCGIRKDGEHDHEVNF